MDFEKIGNDFVNTHNRQLLDDFSGFSPAEMHQIIYSPFDPECPIKFNRGLPDSVLELSPAFQISFALIQKVNVENNLKLTQKGNLPQKLIRSIYNEGHFPERIIEKGLITLRVEHDWIILHTLHLILKMSGILRKTQNKLYLTRKGKKFLEQGQKSSFFYFLLEAYTQEYNWGYNDRYPVEDVGQIGFLYLLNMVKKIKETTQTISYFSEKYFKAFPTFLNNTISEGEVQQKDAVSALETRFFERFGLWFGLIEYVGEIVNFKERENQKIGMTELLDSMLL